MQLAMYQVDAFADRPFAGNPAAVCPLDEWISDELMQRIAMENNLSETAFFVPRDGYYHLRWFTPDEEIDLCGHATLATAHVLFEHLGVAEDEVAFDTQSGRLTVTRDGDLLAMDFPAWIAAPFEVPERVRQALGASPVECLCTRDVLCVFETEEEVRALKPSFDKLMQLDWCCIIATAPGSGEYDFVSRVFCPCAGIPEDPVTGSAHCTLVPYWSKRLGRSGLTACQASARGGVLHCQDNGDRVRIAGSAVSYLEGTITVPEK